MKGSQTPGRKANGAIPLGRPDATTSDEAIEKVGRESTRRAGPDGPDATLVGDTFKRRPKPAGGNPADRSSGSSSTDGT